MTADPRGDDWIGVFVDGYSITETAPVKFYTLADAGPSHLESGSGSVALTLLNLRAPQRVVAFRGGLESPVAVASSDPVSFAHVDEPTGIHLLLGPGGSVRVQWTTAHSASPAVRFVRDGGVRDGGGADWSESPAEDDTYGRGDMCPGDDATSRGFLDPGVLHTATMAGLEPGAVYRYRVGDAGLEGAPWSAELAFTAPPRVGPAEEVRIVALADNGTDEADGSSQSKGWDHYFRGSLAVSEAVLAEWAGGPPGLVVMNGDISYGMGFTYTWERWLAQMAVPLTSAPWLTAPGNHEADGPREGILFHGPDSGGECGVPYAKRLPMPYGPPGGLAGPSRPPSRKLAGPRGVPPAPVWYGVDFGPIHFTQMSTEHPFEPGSPQHAFLAADLAAVDRCRTPWVVLGGHRPFYVDSDNASPGNGDQPVSRMLNESIGPLLRDNGVDMTWTGHHHSYQRTCPVVDGACADGGTVHVVMGHAGAALCTNVLPETPDVFEKVYLGFGWTVVEAGTEGGEHWLRLTSYGVGEGGGRGEVVDEVVLRRAVDAGCLGAA